METITKNAGETKALGKEIGSKLKGGGILALVGDLGAGKTTFLQGLAEGLGVKQRIVSPTFILMRRYPVSHKSLTINHYFYHLDLYRLENNLETEIKNLGLTDLWGRNENIVAIEWAEKIKDLLPLNTKWIKFESLGETERKITL